MIQNLVDMKKSLIVSLLVLLVSCSGNPFHADYVSRMAAHDGALKQFMTLPEGVSAQEKEALEFLYAYMPLADVTTIPPTFICRTFGPA